MDFLEREYLGVSMTQYLSFLAILIVALLFKKYFTAVLTRLFFTVFRKSASAYHGQQFKELLLRPVEGIIVSILFYVAFNQLRSLLDSTVLFKRTKPVTTGEPVVTRMVTGMDVVDHVFLLFLIIYFSLLLARIVDFLILVRLHKAKAEADKERQQLLPLLKDVLKVVIWLVAIFSLLGAIFHVNVAALIAGLGVGGIAIAFAAKESLENLLASFMVMVDKPFTIGDWVKVDNVEGTIEKVGFRSTRIRSFDQSVIILPNRKLIDSHLENFSERGSRRLKITVGAVYGLSRASLLKVIEEIRQLLQHTPGTVGTPSVYLDNFGDYSVNIVITCFISTAKGENFSQIKQEIILGIYELMYRHAKGFAFPTQVEISGEDINEVV